MNQKNLNKDFGQKVPEFTTKYLDEIFKIYFQKISINDELKRNSKSLFHFFFMIKCRTNLKRTFLISIHGWNLWAKAIKN